MSWFSSRNHWFKEFRKSSKQAPASPKKQGRPVKRSFTPHLEQLEERVLLATTILFEDFVTDPPPGWSFSNADPFSGSAYTSSETTETGSHK
ncbi:MAG: hypothetical protein IH914_09065 [candidate division Zixibacteria bacterium]|nr:hypothetical protein [candidate division Zixibacteria bacterium]